MGDGVRGVQEIVAMNQDELGVAGDLIWQQGTRKVRAVSQGGCSAESALQERQAQQLQMLHSHAA